MAGKERVRERFVGTYIEPQRMSPHLVAECQEEIGALGLQWVLLYSRMGIALLHVCGVDRASLRIAAGVFVVVGRTTYTNFFNTRRRLGRGTLSM